MKLSIIIPTYQEEAAIGRLLAYLRLHTSPGTELIVADGGSTDATRSIAAANGAEVLLCSQKGRASQMNAGATVASGEVLYFLHADTFPPVNFEAQVLEAVRQGLHCGCFGLQFDEAHWFLQLNAWFTRFDVDAIRFGDQSLFATKAVFEQARGFDERLYLLEDQEIIHRLRRVARFRVLQCAVTTSARKYRHYGRYKLQGVYFLVYGLYRLGLGQERLVWVYRKLLPS